MLDLDDFKLVNDTLGHVFATRSGMVAEQIRSALPALTCRLATAATSSR